MGIKLFTFYSYWNFPVLVQTYNLKYTEGTATFTIFSNVWFLYFNLTKSVGTICTTKDKEGDGEWKRETWMANVSDWVCVYNYRYLIKFDTLRDYFTMIKCFFLCKYYRKTAIFYAEYVQQMIFVYSI